MDNRTALQKAQLAVTDLVSSGGALQPEQAKKFFRIAIKQSVLMTMALVEPMDSFKKEINKIKFASRMLHGSAENSALTVGNQSAPSLSKTLLDVKLFKAQVNLTNEVLEDSIEKGELRQTVLQLMAEKIGTDMEDIIVNGDILSSDNDYAVLDGVIKQVVGSTSDAQGQTPNDDIFLNMLTTMPSEFIRPKSALRIFTSVDAELKYRHFLAGRMTIAGDAFRGGANTQGSYVDYMGIPIVDVPMFPENLGSGTNQTVALMMDPKNIDIGLYRKLTIETQKDIEKGVLKIVASVRFDVKLVHEPASVKATAIKVG